MQQVVIARTGQRIFQSPEPSSLWPRITASRVPLGNRNPDGAPGCIGLDHPPDRSQIGLHAAKVGAVVMMGRDEVEPGSSARSTPGVGYDERS